MSTDLASEAARCLPLSGENHGIPGSQFNLGLESQRTVGGAGVVLSGLFVRRDLDAQIDVQPQSASVDHPRSTLESQSAARAWRNRCRILADFDRCGLAADRRQLGSRQHLSQSILAQQFDELRNLAVLVQDGRSLVRFKQIS